MGQDANYNISVLQCLFLWYEKSHLAQRVGFGGSTPWLGACACGALLRALVRASAAQLCRSKRLEATAWNTGFSKPQGPQKAMKSIEHRKQAMNDK